MVPGREKHKDPKAGPGLIVEGRPGAAEAYASFDCVGRCSPLAAPLRNDGDVRWKVGFRIGRCR